MINPNHFRQYIIKPTLEYLGMWSPAAENLVFGTAAHESLLYHLKQQGGGPAQGFFQIEGDSHQDLYDNFLNYRIDLMQRVNALDALTPECGDSLIGNLYYSTAVCRLIYYRRPEALPEADDIEGLAQYWKDHYNTHLGKGRVEDWVKHYMDAN
jgi:hypothetical protein